MVLYPLLSQLRMVLDTTSTSTTTTVHTLVPRNAGQATPFQWITPDGNTIPRKWQVKFGNKDMSLQELDITRQISNYTN
jgi:hypothetical protein